MVGLHFECNAIVKGNFNHFNYKRFGVQFAESSSMSEGANPPGSPEVKLEEICRLLTRALVLLDEMQLKLPAARLCEALDAVGCDHNKDYLDL